MQNISLVLAMFMLFAFSVATITEFTSVVASYANNTAFSSYGLMRAMIRITPQLVGLGIMLMAALGVLLVYLPQRGE